MSFNENIINSNFELDPYNRNLFSKHNKNQFKTNNTKSDSLNTSIQKTNNFGEEINDNSLFNYHNDLFDDFSLSSNIHLNNSTVNNNVFDILRLNNNSDSSYYQNIINNFENNEMSKEKSETNEEKINKDESNKKCTIFFTFIKKGRKTKDQKPGEHNKFAGDNIRRKIKHLVLKSVETFINKKIYLMYDGNIGYSINKKKFLKPKGSQKSDATIDFNKAFLDKTIGDIMSASISTQYKSLPPNFNQKLIENLTNEKDDNKKKFFIEFFSLTFLDCLKHYRKSTTLKILEGMKTFEEDKKNEKKIEQGEYLNVIKYYLDNYEIIINNKKPRKSKHCKKNHQKQYNNIIFN